MSGSFENIETALVKNKSVKSILKTFESTYRTTVYPPVQEFQVKLMNRAVIHVRKDLLQKVVEIGWPINGHGHSLSLPLHTACAEGDVDIIKLLLEKGADVNIEANALGQPPGRNSPLYYVMIHDDVVLMTKLLKHYRRTKNNLTPLHFACMKGAEKCAKYLLENKYYAPDHIADNYSMPLEIAVRRSIPITKLLIQHGAPLIHHRDDCMAVIHHAVTPFSVVEPTRLVNLICQEVVRILLDSGADVNVTYQNLTLMEMFFEHIPILYQSLANDEETSDDLDLFWSNLFEAAQVIVEAGLIVNRSNLTQKYSNRLQTVIIRYYNRIDFPDSSSTREDAVAQSFKRSFQLFQMFHSADIYHMNTNVLIETLQMSQELLKYMAKHGRIEYGLEICSAIYKIFRLIYLNIPGQIITTEDFKTVVETFEVIKSDIQGQDVKLLSALIYFLPLTKLHELRCTIPDDLISYRISLKCLAKLAVISAIQFPREDNIRHLDVPSTLKNCLLLMT